MYLMILMVVLYVLSKEDRNSYGFKGVAIRQPLFS